jgi:hypothetical protein
MYRIIGADGKEYGPISADVLRSWIAQGRANAATRVLPEGASDWTTISQLAEFAADLSAKATPLTPPPNTPLNPAAAQTIETEILARDYRLEIGRCFTRGWDLMTKHFWLTVGATFLIHFIGGALSSTLLGIALTAVLWGGLDWMFLKLIRGEKAELGDAFAGFSLAFAPLALFGLVAALLVLLGLALCVVPGIYLLVCWFIFPMLLMVDKRFDFWAAMELSRKVVTRHWWQAFGFTLLCALMLFAGILVCGVGIFIALPWVTAARVYAYEDVFGTRAAAP